MTRRVLLAPDAARDLEEQVEHIARDNPEVALYYSEAAHATFQRLAGMPETGAPRNYRDQRLSGLRMARVRGFERYLIFYRPTEGGIEILRVLHASRDIEPILTS